MRPQITHRTAGGYFVLMMLVAAGAHGQQEADPACTNELLRGWYSFGGSGLELPGPGSFPASVIGTFYADGQGKMTTFRLQEAVNTPPDFMGFLVLSRDPVAEGAVPAVDYNVEPDCSGRITWLDQTPFEADVETALPFVLANGGREGWALRTEPASTFLLSFKRMDGADRSLGSQLEQLSSDLAATKRLLDAVAIRNGLPASQFE